MIVADLANLVAAEEEKRALIPEAMGSEGRRILELRTLLLVPKPSTTAVTVLIAITAAVVVHDTRERTAIDTRPRHEVARLAQKES